MGSDPRLRIAILEADTPLDGTRAKYGSYGGVFAALLHAGADSIAFPRENLILSNYDVVQKMEYPDLDAIDGILITGSRYDSFESDQWITKLVEFTKQVLAQDRVRVIGVCFGHQIVGRALGLETGRSGHWEASVCDVELTLMGKEVFNLNKLTIHQMHKDVIFGYPEGVAALGHSPTCENQGMLIPKRLITVQGHPEFTEEIVRELLVVRHGQKVFTDDQFHDMTGRVANKHDGVIVSGAFLKFLLDGR